MLPQRNKLLAIIVKQNRVLILICLVVAAVISGACSEEQANKDTKFLTYSNEAITFEYPDWLGVSPEEDEVFLLKSNGSSVFSVARYAVPSTMMKREMEQNLGAVFEGKYAYHRLGSDEAALNAVTRVLYSDYETYTLTLAGSIASVVAFFPVGVAAVILVAQPKTEFEKAK